MPDTSKLEKLNRELEKSEKKLRKAINDEKALQHQLKPVSYTHLLNGGSGFNPDEEYTDWQWWLARSEGGQWKLLTYGY